MNYKKQSKNIINLKNLFLLIIFLLLFIYLILFFADYFLYKKFGLGKPLLYYHHPNYGYALRPNQEITRFGNKIKIDKFGSRSNFKNHNQPKIIFYGDSVVYGGRIVDNNELVSELVCENLKKNNSCLNFGTNAYGLENVIRRIDQDKMNYKKDFAIILFNFNNLKRGVSKISGQPFYNKPIDGKFKAVKEIFLRYLDIKRLKYRYTQTNKLDWEEYDKYLFNKNGKIKDSILFYYASLLNNLFDLVNSRFDNYLIIINFSEKNKNEKYETSILRNLMKKYDFNKVFILKEQLENNEIDISKIFYDNVHFNKYGHKIVGNILAKYLKENYENFN